MKIELPPSSIIAVCFVLFISAMHLLGGINQRQLIKKQQSEKGLKIERPKPSLGFSILITQISLILFLIVSYKNGWNFTSVGLKFEIFPIISLIVGSICYILFTFGLIIILKILKLLEATEDDTYRVMLRLTPRQKLPKILFLIGVCIFNPITEELMFRGILVHQLGLFINNHLLAIALGLFINLGNHIYQGKLQIATHIIFYLIAIALLYSPFGLIGAIGFHFAGDIYPFISLKRSAINYRNRIRNKRAVKDTSN
ncbi:CPBP family intramembrane metalloprotease [Plectonema cf. radiosum LEGE 06105]|uniref:CPBP family intramembrane metalloprotease n=1 Tax=Plectonema cf. radiosum LEGE 06105 TaxID=945769 RepID=A0A8J7F1D4_9CYAN|nr:CPBP family intramembrane glutamic endopeptidase [Plectonema radiosum]MBE9212850.1 CPBP family intramembrane metalloprotease [Plectonema cf. radiosum LEGE 06105]